MTIKHAVSADFSAFADLEEAPFASFRADHGLMGCYPPVLLPQAMKRIRNAPLSPAENRVIDIATLLCYNATIVGICVARLPRHDSGLCLVAAVPLSRYARSLPSHCRKPGVALSTPAPVAGAERRCLPSHSRAIWRIGRVPSALTIYPLPELWLRGASKRL